MNAPMARTVAYSVDRRTSWPKRLGYGALTLFFVGFIVTEVVWSPNSAHNRTKLWAPLLFLVLPDAALLAGAGRGQIHPRAVRLYNLVHRLWLGPMLLIALGFMFPYAPVFWLAWGGAPTSRSIGHLGWGSATAPGLPGGPDRPAKQSDLSGARSMKYRKGDDRCKRSILNVWKAPWPTVIVAAAASSS